MSTIPPSGPRQGRPEGVPDDHVVVGQVGKPFGNRGDVFLFADPDLSETFEPGTRYHTPGRPQGLTVISARVHTARLVVSFEGFTSREQAETIRGTVLSRARDEVPLDEEFIWVTDLLGRTVVDVDGSLVGVVASVTDGHAHDYLVIARPDGGESVVPMVDELVDYTVDPIVLQPVVGLIDPDDAW